MPTQRRGARGSRKQDDELEDDQGDVAPEDDRNEVALRELDSVFNDLPSTVKVKVYRLAENGALEWCWTGQPNAVSEERIAKFGPGEYVLQARGELPNGGKGFRRQHRIHIAATPTSEAPTAAPPAQPTTTDLVSAGVVAMLQQMSRANREHDAAMAVLLERLSKPDPIVEKLLSNAIGGRQPDPFEVAERIASIGAKANRGGGGIAELATTLEALDRLKERFRGDEGDAGGGMSWPSFFSQLLGKIPANGNARGPELVEDPNGPHIESVEARPPVRVLPHSRPSPVKFPEYLAPMAPFVPELVGAAERGTDPGSVADWFVANLPDAALPIARGVLQNDGVVADLIAGEPRLREHREFLVAVRDEMLAAIATAEQPDDEAAAEPA